MSLASFLLRLHIVMDAAEDVFLPLFVDFLFLLHVDGKSDIVGQGADAAIKGQDVVHIDEDSPVDGEKAAVVLQCFLCLGKGHAAAVFSSGAGP